jgi:hypothetical protein
MLAFCQGRNTGAKTWLGTRNAIRDARSTVSGHQTAQAQVLNSELGRFSMKYMFAWLLGVPGVIIIAWFLLNHH